MTRTDLEQAVARAHYEKYFEGLLGDLEPRWDELPESHKFRLVEAARAALSAIEEAGWVLVEMPKERPMRSRLGPGET